MSERPYHKSVRLRNFTVFKDVEIQFVPGINAFVGENGTGKTHLMKALYAIERVAARTDTLLDATLERLFQVRSHIELIRQVPVNQTSASLRYTYGGDSWGHYIPASNGGTSADEDRSAAFLGLPSSLIDVDRPVFIPSFDMMGHAKGFLQASNEVVLDFDLTCSDMVALIGIERNNSTPLQIVLDKLTPTLGGRLEYDGTLDRFFLVNALGRFPAPLMPEGIRKIATLVRLLQNGWIGPKTTLFWDEPEVNLNPALMDEVVSAILAMARSGVQVFLATHSYIILKELELQKQKRDSFRMFAMERNKDDGSVTVSPADSYDELAPNLIERQYERILDMQIDRALGG